MKHITEPKYTWNDWRDFTGNNIKAGLHYVGPKTNRPSNLEGRIFSTKDGELTLGVSLHRDDIAGANYDEASQSLLIFYGRPEKPIARSAILPMTEFDVPASIEDVVIYNVGDQLFRAN